MGWVRDNHVFISTMLRDIVGRLQAAADPEATAQPPPWGTGWPEWSHSRPSRLADLVERLSLTPFERDLLLLCVAQELEGEVAALCGTIHGNPELNFPTIRLALKVLGGGTWRAVSEASPLRRWHLLSLAPGPTRTLARLHCDERVWQHLLGVSSIEGSLADIVEETPALHPLDTARMTQAKQVSQLLAADLDPPVVVQLTGHTASAQVSLATSAAKMAGREIVRIPISRLPLETAALSKVTRKLSREAVLSPRVMLLDVHPDAPDPIREAAVRAIVQSVRCPCVVATQRVLHIPGRSPAVLQVLPPTELDQRAVWEAVLDGQPSLTGGRTATDAALELGAAFSLEPLDIEGVVQQAKLEGGTPWEACRVLARSRMGPLAEHIGKRATWEDLVLPEGQRILLDEIAQHARQRATVFGRWGMGASGQGLAVLFSGPSGTGKTLAARALAAHLELDLWRIDLSRVVDKYVGETEKNLARVFDAAESGGAVLLFDEADALFGKRSAVKDSHDRYANIQVGYLLQRMEAYRGVAILTTNLKASLDPAFIRRLRFIVDFPMPDLTARAEIWRRVLPEQLPTRQLSYERLAQLNVTGAVIAGIATHGAVLAAEEGPGPDGATALRMHHLKKAAIREFQKHGQPITRPELRGWDS